MALFASLSERLKHIFSKLTKRGKLTELEIRTAMREVRIALLEADVNLKVAKQFIAEVSEKAVGQEVLQSLNPAQQVIKIVNDELIALMGSGNAKLEVSPKPPTVILMCGLQGAGKTTLCGKLAIQLKKQGKKPHGETFLKQLGVFIFVAVPLPMTGVWTGTAIAVFLGLKFREAILPVVLGNLVAGLIIAALAEFCIAVWEIGSLDYVLWGLFALAAVLLIITVIKISTHKDEDKKEDKTKESGE